MKIYKNFRPEISIILPTYNRSKYLSRAIESVINQEFKNWELIVVDDGSIDNTFKIVKSYISDYENIRYIYQGNMKQSIARNVGIKLSSSKYICFLDSDDEYKTDYLSERIRYISKNNYDLIHGGADIIGKDEIVDKNDTSKMIHLSDCIIGGTIFSKRQVLQSLGGFNEKLDYSEDSDLVERALIKYKISRFENKSYVYYRGKQDSISNRMESNSQSIK